MKITKSGYSSSFLNATHEAAKEYAGIQELVDLWEEASTDEERNLIKEDIQDLLNDIAYFHLLENSKY